MTYEHGQKGDWLEYAVDGETLYYSVSSREEGFYTNTNTNSWKPHRYVICWASLSDKTPHYNAQYVTDRICVVYLYNMDRPCWFEQHNSGKGKFIRWLAAGEVQGWDVYGIAIDHTVFMHQHLCKLIREYARFISC